MSNELARHPRLESHLAKLLHHGSWLGCGVIAAGMVLCLLSAYREIGTATISAGVVLLIVLPVLRVLVMLYVFLREGDRRFAVIATIVLLVIGLSTITGLISSGAMSH